MSQRTFNWPSQSITTTSAPIQYDLNGSPTTVSQDTGTPANSTPMPVIMLDSSGNPVSPGGDATLAEQQVQSGLLQDISDQQLGVVNAGNSSTTPLGIGGVFTGTAVEITNFSAINVAVKSDVASATNGLSMQFSPDGTNWDHTHDYTVGVNGVSFAQAAELRYFRIVYTNGAVAQSSFRLTTILKRNEVSPSRYTVEQQLFGGQMADVVKANIWGLTTGGGGGYVAVKVNPSGALTVEADVTDTVGLTDTELRATPVAVSGPLTDAELRATAVPVSGPLTDAELRATAVPVSGPLTDAELRASAVPVSGTFFQATQPVSLATVPASSGRNKVEQLFNDYTVTSVTTSAYTQLVASTSAAANKIEIFDSSGEALILAVGGAGSEVDQLYIFPGGNGAVDLAIPASSRISVKAKTATASSGFLAINLYS